MKDTLEPVVSGAVRPMFFSGFFVGVGGGGSKGSTFPTNRKKFSDKPKIFPDYNILNLHPPSTTLTISDNLDNFPTISDNIGNFPTGLNNRGAMPPPPGHGATACGTIRSIHRNNDQFFSHICRKSFLSSFFWYLFFIFYSQLIRCSVAGNIAIMSRNIDRLIALANCNRREVANKL